MKSEFKHPVTYGGEVIAVCPSPEEAARFHEAIHDSDEIEIFPPPPPMKLIGESGIPEHLFERGQSEMIGSIIEVVELKTPEQLALLKETHSIVGKDIIGGKVMLTVRRNTP